MRYITFTTIAELLSVFMVILFIADLLTFWQSVLGIIIISAIALYFYRRENARA
jgi:hypothetical protein